MTALTKSQAARRQRVLDAALELGVQRRLRRRADARRRDHRRRRPRHDLPLLLLEGPPARRGAGRVGPRPRPSGARPAATEDERSPTGSSTSCAGPPTPWRPTRSCPKRSSPPWRRPTRTPPGASARSARSWPRRWRWRSPTTSTGPRATTSSARSATSGSRRSSGWVNRWYGIGQAGDELEIAAHLLLDQYD